MSHTYLETTKKKTRRIPRVRRAFQNMGSIEELPVHASMHKVSHYGWEQDAGVTLYNKLEKFLLSHVGHSADATYSEFLHVFCTGLSERWVEEAKRLYKDWFVSDLERATRAPWRKDVFVDARGILQMRTPVKYAHDMRSKISLVAVPKAKWEHSDAPEAWQKTNSIWFRLVFSPSPFNSLVDYQTTPFAQSGRDMDFRDVALHHRRTCPKKEITRDILPELRRRELLYLI